MDVITPHLSVALTLEEFVQGHGNEFPEKFIIQPDGVIMKRTELPFGRSLQYKVPSLPTRGNAKIPKLEEEIAFLPNGKVPIRMLHQIVDFFKRVMEDMGGTTVRTHGALEAMAHIVWNPAQPHIYQTRIPTQKVSAAAVDYEFDHLIEGDIIVVDIHSHNSMGAFFSGTDNNDDKKNTCYSGVVGKLDTANPQTIWRFNDLNHKIECELDAVFAADEVKCPDEWMDKVTRGFANVYNWNQRNSNAPLANRGAGNVPSLPGRVNKNGSATSAAGGNNFNPHWGGEDDLYGGLQFGEDDPYMIGLTNEAEDELTKLEESGIDLGFGGVGAKSDEQLLLGMIAAGKVDYNSFAVVLPRFYLQSVNRVELWLDKYSEDEATGECEYLTDSEKEAIVDSEGEFMMYISGLDMYMTSIEIEEDSEIEELWDIFSAAETNVVSGHMETGTVTENGVVLDSENDDEMSQAMVELERTSARKDLTEFLAKETTPMDRVLLTAYLFILYEAGELKTPVEKDIGERENVQLH